MALWIKQGVYGELNREAANGLRKVKVLYQAWNEDLFVTSIREGTHSAVSLHPQGDAWDMRYPVGKKSSAAVKAIKVRLGEGFDVVPEKDHIHCEYDPK